MPCSYQVDYRHDDLSAVRRLQANSAYTLHLLNRATLSGLAGAAAPKAMNVIAGVIERQASTRRGAGASPLQKDGCICIPSLEHLRNLTREVITVNRPATSFR